MKNKEKFEKDILEIAYQHDRCAVKNGKLTPCRKITCNQCDFNPRDSIVTCGETFKKWLEMEYQELKIQPKVKHCRIDDKILVSDDGVSWKHRHFAKCGEECVYTWYDGATSWTAERSRDWKYAKLPEGEQ